MKRFLIGTLALHNVGVLSCALIYSVIVGCGPQVRVDENRTGITGTVTFADTPLRAGTITFDSTEKTISTAISIGQDGRYATNRVPIGPNIVTIDTESLRYGSPHLYTKIPAKYADPSMSGLTIDVKPGTNENVNFDLKP
jgi:hypothetical protein